MKYLLGKVTTTVFILLYTSMSLCMHIPENKWYYIKPIGQGDLCYDIKDGSCEDCTPVQLYQKCSGNKNQQFMVKRANTHGAYYIIPRHSYDWLTFKVLDICEGSIADRASCILYHNIYARGHGIHRNQEFYITSAGGGLWRIINVQSGLALGFNEDGYVVQKLLNYGPETVLQFEEVN